MSSDRHNSRQSRPWRPLKRLMQSLLRLLFRITGSRRRSPQAGFVFPTTLLLVLMLLLTVSALTFRTFTRSSQNIGQRDQQVIYNSATPAIDRAKAKIEFMFREDPRFPSGVPPSDFLADMMAVKHDPANEFVGFANSRPVPPLDADIADPYTLPDEERIDINGDGNLDNAWAFDSSGELVVYSVLVDDTFFEGDGGGSTAVNNAVTEDDPIELADPADDLKAEALVTRTGPLATTEATDICKGAAAEGGWQIVQNADNSSLQKNFQVDVFVADRNSATDTFETLEFQQSRIAARSNKWGAWFRYDLEIFPGSDFNWNGAMHTDGSISLHAAVEPHMVSSHNSCLYSKRSSEITLGKFDNNGDGVYNVADGDFEGQAIKGFVEDDSYKGGTVKVHVWDQNDNTKPLTGNEANFTQDTDSVDGGSPSEIAMDPFKLFTEDIAQHTNVGDWERDEDWNEEDSEFVARGRIYNDEVSRPFVDDFYRADNRWGPKPRYDSRDSSLDLVNNTDSAGNPIVIGKDIESEPKLTNDEDGLDGYWERQAIQKGLRIIVGQRLELGNVNGWNNDPTGNSLADPLYPATESASALGANARFGGNHEYLQRRKLRDNLAAVQGMVVYHYQINDGQFPAACVALTAHPGTEQTIINSRTFDYYPTSTTTLKADFLNGKGTNGWEFRYPDAFDTEAEFKTQLDQGDPLGDVLRNWAYLAGDPDGGAPSFEPVQDSNIHPAPYFSMWGDAAPLRRIFDDYLDNGSTYDDLSFADRATLHSAACTVSLLAYNIDKGIDEYEAVAGDDLTSVGVELWALIDPGNNGTSTADLSNYVGATYDTFPSDHPLYPDEPIILTPNIPARADWVDPNPGQTCPDTSVTDTVAFEVGCDEKDYYDQFTTEDFIRAYISENDQNETQLNTALDNVEKIRSFVAGYQILRDRALGFIRGPLPSELTEDSTGDSVGWDEANLVTLPGTSQLEGKQYSSSCDPDIFTNIDGSGIGKGPKRLGLAVAFCSTKLDTKYPSLYYLFPTVQHDHDGQDESATGGYNHQQPSEPYIDDTYVSTTNGTDNGVVAKRFEVLTDANITAIAAEPAQADLSDWVLPATTNANPLTDPDADDSAQAFRITTPAGSGIDVPFLDKGIANGRQQLSVRVLDIDVDKLVGSDKPGTDYWLSADLDAQAEGIVYAYREDAVREDEIVRPANSSVDAATCIAPSAGGYPFTIETDADCQMNASPGAEQDPPLTDLKISLKPVDFAPDPMRSADGFRFRASSGNPIDFSGPDLDRQVGMTFVTDNAAYVQGDFNIHSDDGTPDGILEEFVDAETLLDGDVDYGDDFYTERENLDLENFANLSVDHWRPVEILADEIDLLSSNFKDGAIIDAFIQGKPGSRGGATSSYMNLYRPNFSGSRDPDFYVLENPDDLNSPIYIDRNATFYVNRGPTTINPYYSDAAFNVDNEWVKREKPNSDHNNNLQNASGVTYINSVFVSGLVPQRPNQSYGGLHNFPRFNEDWGGGSDELFIQGSFLQLNFSTAGTAPFDHDAWEPDDTTQPGNDGEFIGYYSNPDRNWGFDVGLLYVPPAPAARRFVSIGVPRNEYYREIPGDDPYIKNLRCAEDSDGTQLFPNLCNK